MKALYDQRLFEFLPWDLFAYLVAVGAASALIEYQLDMIPNQSGKNTMVIKWVIVVD